MCIGCAITAASAATGVRSWLQNRPPRWMTTRRLRAATITLMCAAGLASTVGLSGSSAPASRAAAHVSPAATGR